MTSVCEIGGLPIQDLTYDEALARIVALIRARKPARMAVTNASKTVLAQAEPGLHEFIVNSDIVTADGMSVVWAARLLGKPLRERVTGIDMMEMLVATAGANGFKVYFLGAKPEVVERVVELYKQRFPNLEVAGFHHGYLDRAGEDFQERLREAAPDILFVAMGSPAQENWIQANQAQLGIPFCLGVGGSFDHVAGYSRRAPIWMQDVGLEWLYRLGSEPGRLWRRYLIGNSKFISLVVKQWLWNRKDRST